MGKGVSFGVGFFLGLAVTATAVGLAVNGVVPYVDAKIGLALPHNDSLVSMPLTDDERGMVNFARGPANVGDVYRWSVSVPARTASVWGQAYGNGSDLGRVFELSAPDVALSNDQPGELLVGFVRDAGLTIPVSLSAGSGTVSSFYEVKAPFDLSLAMGNGGLVRDFTPAAPGKDLPLVWQVWSNGSEISSPRLDLLNTDPVAAVRGYDYALIIWCQFA